MKSKKRKENEKKFSDWEILNNGGRKYWFEISGRLGWKAKYIKVVDKKEITKAFYQEIYNDKGKLVEIHEKYPIDMGHKKIK